MLFTYTLRKYGTKIFTTSKILLLNIS